MIKKGTSTENHQIILELASSSKGTRVVTTNFDDLFEKARKEFTNQDDIKIYNAPLIPMADSIRWSGIIKIHGSLDTNNKKHSDDIVISSGDFGRAYLTERWASQFIIDMFKYFHVLFIGYSISDPIFRYIIDAIAIDKLSNLNLKTSYILLQQAKDNKNDENTASSYNGLNKIFYKHTGDDKDHSDLYKKLEEWLEYAAGSVRTKEIINELKSPQNINNKEKKAKLLKHLKNNPEAIKYFREDDTNKADIAWLPTLDEEIITPYLTSNSNSKHDKDAICYLSAWFASNLDKYEVIDWLLKSYQIISPVLYNNINLQRAQNYYSNKYNEILDVLLNKTLLQTSTHEEVWHLSYICNRIKETPTVFSIGLKSRILELLRPRIKLRDKNLSAAIKYLLDKNTVQEEEITKEIIEECYQYIFQLSTPEKYNLEKLHAALASSKSAFADLSIDIIGLLKDAFDLIYLITKNKSTYIEKGFIAPSQDETKFHRHYSYLSLVDMARDSIKSLLDVDQSKAFVLLQIMMIEGANTDNGYPVLSRIALYLLDSNTDLTANDKMNLVWPTIKYWLCERECKREASDFIKNIWLKLTQEQQEKVWSEIRAKIKEIDKNNDNETNITVIEICRRILWIRNIENNIPNDMVQFLSNHQYDSANDSFLYSDHQEFKVQYGGSYDEQIEYTKFTSYSIQEHIELLNRLNDSDNSFYQLNNAYELWRSWAEKNFIESFTMLQNITLSDSNFFYSQVWKNVIYGLCGDTVKSAIEFEALFKELLSLKDLDIESIASEICWAVKKCSEIQNLIEFDKILFIKVFVKILPFASKIKVFNAKDDPFNVSENNYTAIWYDDAINHPIGYITQALINLLISKSDRKYNKESLSFTKDFKNLWGHVANKECNIYVKAILTSKLYDMYILIPEWSKTYIIPLFSWENDNKQYTCQYWYSYLSYDLRISKNLIRDITKDLLISLENLQCFANPVTRSNLIHLVILLWRETNNDFECIPSKLIKKEDQVSAVVFFEHKIRLSRNKKIIGKEYTALKELLKEFTKIKKPVDSTLSYWIMRTLLTTPYNFYQIEWDDFWASIINHINNDYGNILCITDEILFIDNGGEDFNLWQEPVFILKILNRIINPGFSHIGYLKDILVKIERVIPLEELNNNDDYKKLCEIRTKHG